MNVGSKSYKVIHSHDHDHVKVRVPDSVPLNHRIVDKMIEDKVTEEDLEAEFDECRELEKAILRTHAAVDRKFRLPGGRVSPTPSVASHGTAGVHKAGYKLPKIRIPQFSGEYKDWIGWWTQFKKIHEDEDLDPSDKFTYLKQAMKDNTSAKRLMDGYPLSAENYPLAVEDLKTRFGKREILIDVYIRDLLSMIVQATDQKEKTDLTTMYDKIRSSLRALDNLGKIDKSHFLFPMLESCLPVHVLRAWQRSLINCIDPNRNKLDQLLEFLANEVEGDARIALARQGLKAPEQKKTEKSSNFSWKAKKAQNVSDLPTAMGLVTLSDSKDRKEPCIFCDKPHSSAKCWEAKKMSDGERKAIIMKRGGCFNCLRRGHMARDCPEKEGRPQSPSSSRNQKSEGYHIVPPPQSFVRATPSAYQSQGVDTTAPASNQVLTTANLLSSPDVLLPTFMVGVCGSNGKIRRIRAALDTMSAYSYLTKRVIEDLRIPHRGTTLFNHAVFGGSTQRIIHKKYTVRLHSLNGTFSCSAEIYDQDQISSGIPAVPTFAVLEELKQHGVYLSERCQNMKEVDLLIGGDLAGKVLTGRQIPLALGPTGLETRFGWTVVGKVLDERGESFTVHSMVNFNSPVSMWELEAIAIQDPVQKLSKDEEDELTMEHFRNTVSRNIDGRYQISLPWVESASKLPDNLAVAKKRLESATKKLVQQNMVKEYQAVFDEWLTMGVIEEIEPTPEEHCHYLPHRPVIKMESSTTKIRPVFDASCKTKTVHGTETPSLNDCLLKGPNLLEQIPNILMRFREDRIAATADIRKAFLMIEVKPEDRKFLRFIWWKDPENKVQKIYQHCRVVFGVNCSPFLLNAVIAHHLDESMNEENREVLEKLKSCLYVDNVAASFPSEEAYQDFRKTSVKLLDDAKFDLRLWESNLDQDAESPITGVLGMKWDREKDLLFCDSSLENLDLMKITKKTILSALARIFDPLGILAPVVLVPKCLMQACWMEKLGWDVEVPREVKVRFLSWIEEMRKIREAVIPRYIGVPTETSSVHIFCDACEHGYAAVAFLRLVQDEVVEIKFLMCRARVAPLEKTTINRLELISCEIATRLGETLKEAFGWTNVPFNYWTDSTTAKAWIVRDKDWGTFVGNRVRKIRAVTRPEDWRHVPGLLNPADLPSRGCGLQELIDSNWWKGPAWLRNKPESWPNVRIEDDEDDISKELKKTTVTAVSLQKDEPWYSPKKCRIGTFRGIVRVVAWLLRFISNCRAKKLGKAGSSKPLSLEENRIAERKVFCMMQQESKMQENSFPFRVKMDENSLLRVQTKLTYRDDEEAFKFPVIIPGNHYLTGLLINDAHRLNNHAGTQFLLAHLREKVWITHGRRSVSEVVKSCVRCKRFTSKNVQPVTAPLPPNRVRDATPFEITGVDLAGPLYLKSGKKTWICLYTCAVYRAVHLELVTSLSTEAFLTTLRKFVARRGRPKVIYTDNGTNFVGASRLLKQVDWNEIEKNSEALPIKWIFSPPSAPWWGGWWERLVRSMKELMVRILGKRVLKQEELEAVLCDVEATLNGRPLTYVFDDDVLVPLTPNLFLHGPKEDSTPELDVVDRDMLQRRYRYRQQIMENLRQRFRREYLGQLLQRKKEKGTKDLMKGDVVLLGNDCQKRLMWPVGAIQEIIEGRDNVVRVAKVRTNKGVYTRPVQRLYPLEIPNPDESLDGAVRDAVKRTRSGRIVKPISRYGWE